MAEDEPLIGRDAVRPEETAAERLRWAYGIDPSGNAERVLLDAVDYRGQKRSAVIDDVMYALGLLTL